MDLDSTNIEINNKIKLWDEYSKFHIYSATSILIKIFKDKEDLVVVDVGANSGTYFDELNNNLKINKAILFEVHPLIFNYIKEKYQNKPNIIVENIALSDRVQGFSLNDKSLIYDLENRKIGDNNYNFGLSYIDYDQTSQTKTNFFDNIRSKYNLDKIDILKIDTETEDLLVLKGFTQTIKNLSKKPVIEFECNWWIKYTYEESKKILDNFCRECGYNNNIDLNLRGDHFLFPLEDN